MTQVDGPSISDELAKERTQLAKERTLLAYIRTAIGFLAMGTGMMQFFEAPGARFAAWVFMAAGLGLVLLGIARFRSRRNRGM